VGLQNIDIAEGGTQIRALHDFHLWKESLSTVEHVSAARTDPYNVISDDGRAAPIRGAEMSASGFRALGVAPLAGRMLLESDEVPGAPDVVVIAHDVWQSRLAGDPNAVGSTIRIGTVPHEIVGIMPAGFLFPMNDHLWLPLRHQPTDYERGMGPDIRMFGRLREGVSLEQAQAELTTMGRRMASEFPDTHERLRPEVMGYTAMITGADSSELVGLYVVQFLIFALLGIVCGNVGTLILARTATRSGEMALRTALGASRGRIVSQLFVESLVLAVLSCGIGLVLGELVARAIANTDLFLEIPFWLDFGVSFKTAATALSIAAFCAVIAGVLPALKATGTKVQRNLQQTGTGSAIRFGVGATVLIVAEVALAVGFLIVGGTLSRSLLPDPSVQMAIEPDEFAVGMLRIPWTDHSALENDLSVADFRAQVVQTHEALKQRLSAEPGVRGVAMGSALPGMGHPTRMLEVDGEQREQGFEGHAVMYARVDVDFFAGLGTRIENGRDFGTGDLHGTPFTRTPVIVNTAFVEHVLGGGNPIGRRVRYVAQDSENRSPWYEIVGVVGHLGMNAMNPARDEGVYHPAAPGELHPIWTAVRVGENPMSFQARFRQATSEVDPDAMIQYPSSLDRAQNEDQTLIGWMTLLMAALAGIAIVLSAAGLYALMSFTVSQRTREIGIRTALGARPGGIVVAIARRAFLQLVSGIAVGVASGAWLITQLEGDVETRGTNWALMLSVIAAFVLLVGMLACVAPTLRGLRIRPVEALKQG
jgi:predicted permease